MNIIFISPNYPAGHKRYVTALREAGHTVLGIGDAGDETFAPELRGALNGYYRVGDLHDYDSVYRACCYYTWQNGRIDRIESLNPYWRDLVSALTAEICTQPDCPENHYSKQAALGIKSTAMTPRMISSSPKKVCTFAAEHGYPLLAVAAGNKRLGSRMIVADAGVKSLLRGSTKDEYVFAAAPEGEALWVDGLVLDGKVAVCAAHQRSEDGQSVVSLSVDGLAEKCQTAAEDHGLANGFFHISAVKLTSAVAGFGKKGTVCFVTFQPVPTHEYIIDLMDMEFGCDLRRSWAEGRLVMRCEEPCTGWSENTDGAAVKLSESEEAPETETVEPAAPELPLAPLCPCGLAVRSFERSYKNLHEKILRKLGVKLVFHGRTEEPDRWEYSDYVYLFSGESAAELKRSIKFITEDHPLSADPEKLCQVPAAGKKTAKGKSEK